MKKILATLLITIITIMSITAYGQEESKGESEASTVDPVVETEEEETQEDTAEEETLKGFEA